MNTLEPTPTNRGQLYRAPQVRRTVPSAASQHEDGEISLAFILGVWNQWWKWLIPVSLLLMAASAAIVFVTFQPKFRSSARIEIAEQAPWVIQQDTDQRALQYVATQIEMLRGARVLNSVMEDPKVVGMSDLQKKRDPVKWLSDKGLEVSSVRQSTLVEVAFSGVDPVSSAYLVNKVVDSYFDIQDAQKTIRTQGVLRALKNSKTMQADQVARLQKLVKQYSRDLDVVPNLSSQTVMMRGSTPAQDIMNQIAEADFELAHLEADVVALQESLSDESFAVSQALVQAEIANLPEVKARLLDIQQKEVLLGQIEATAAQGTASTTYINTQNEIKALKSALEVLRAESENAIVQQVREMDRVDLETKLKLKRTELKQKREHIAKLEERYDRERNKVNKEGNKRLEFEFASQELQRALGLFAKISEREAHMTAELGAPGRPEVFRRATPPKEPEKKYPIIELTATTLASLILPFGIAFLWENAVRRINSVQQLEAKTNVEVIGEISRLPARQGRNAKLLGHELGLFEESIDSLRTSLLLSNDQHEVQVIAVCSAVSGEGKTSVSSQLAVSIARATGQPILLIDGDMRAPDIHQIFEVPRSPGLADVLDGKCSVESAINRDWSDHVHILPAGELDKSPHKLLGTPAFRSLIDEARLWYRYIIVDTPPVLAASESLVIAKQADGAIVCTMRDFSRENHVSLAHARLSGTGAQVIGTVLNGVPVRSYASRYGSYGKYGYANQS